MSRFRLILAGVALAAVIEICTLWWQPRPTLPEPPVQQQITRGAAVPQTPEQIALAEAMQRLSHESSTLPLTWIQAGVTFNGDIPLWGIIVLVIGGIASFAALKVQMNSHETSDERRFTAQEKINDNRAKATDDILKELRGDVKRLLIHYGVDND